MLLVGDDADAGYLARRLDGAGYVVGCTTPEEALGVIGSICPAVVMIMPGVPAWQKTQVCQAIKARCPEVKVVVLRKRQRAGNVGVK